MLFIQDIASQFVQVITFPLAPGERIYWFYLLGSLLIAIGIYRASTQRRNDRQQGLGFIRGTREFLFPRHVWQHPSAWVDVRYFVPHQMVRLWIYGYFLSKFGFLSQGWVLALLRSLAGGESIFSLPADNLYVVFGMAVVSLLATDFVAFYMHYLQHKIPALWAFHKVHHSAEVMHPLTNYREHPVDNIAYAITFGITVGLIVGIFQFLFGARPMEIIVPVLSVSLPAFIFNISAYNLRHSHIWLRWPGALAKVFGSPAHHQIHHSCKPAHLDRNFAFMFPVWDILFGTYYLPEQKEEMDFGLGDGTERYYNSFIAIYKRPFIDLFHRNKN